MSNSTNLPPPPPPMMTSQTYRSPYAKYFSAQAKGCDIDECTWADEWPDLQKACYLNRVCAYAPPKACQYNDIPSILQNGPTCGLAALSMLFDGTPATEELVKIAKQLNYTNNGEMFSAKNLFKLICDTVADGTVSQLDCQMYEGQLNCAKVRECLLSGACMFAAYPF